MDALALAIAVAGITILVLSNHRLALAVKAGAVRDENSLSQRVIVLETKVHKQEKEIAELREHVHDLAFVFSRQDADQPPITKELK